MIEFKVQAAVFLRRWILSLEEEQETPILFTPAD